MKESYIKDFLGERVSFCFKSPRVTFKIAG